MRINKKIFKELLAENQLNYEKLCDEFKKRGDTLSVHAVKLWNRNNNPGTPELDKLLSLGEIFKINPFSLIEDKRLNLYKETNFLRVPVKDIYNIKKPVMNYREVPINEIPKGVDKNKLLWVEVVGSQMNPIFFEGDFVLIEAMTLNDFSEDGYCFINFDGLIQLRYLAVQDSDCINIICENAKYPTITYNTRKDKRQFDIIGRVVTNIRMFIKK